MQSAQLNTDIHPVSDLCTNIDVIIEELKKTKRPIVITQHGKSAAVMLDVTEYENLLEKIELLTDIHIAETQLQESKGILHRDAKRKILERIKI
jgi:prevent-host-death family protein